MSTTTTVTSRLQSLLSGEPLPKLPDWNQVWDLGQYHLAIEDFHRRLLEYIRRLFGKITEANIIATLGGVGLGDWRYNATTHKFQVKRFKDDGTLGDWENAPADQPTQVTEVYDWQYDTVSHKFQKKTQSFYVLENASASGWTDVYTAQSVTNLTEWHYDATTHKFQYKTQADYVLEKASVSSYTNAPADQPVRVHPSYVENVRYDTTDHKFYETPAGFDLYALEGGSSSSAETNIVQLVDCSA